MINYEIPSAAIPKLSVAFRTIENNKADLDIIDYALSQSTLEQVFLKQIRPNTEVSAADGGSASLTGSELRHGGKNGPSFLDYFNGYSIWLLAGIIPGLHQFYLGDTWRGVKYFFTLNEVFVGWLLDLFEMHVLIQKRVEQYGSSHVPFCCSCCYSVKAARTAPSTNGSLRGSTNSTSAGMQNPLAGSSDRQ